MSLRRVLSGIVFAPLFALLLPAGEAQSAPPPAPPKVVSIGDVIAATDAQAASNPALRARIGAKGLHLSASTAALPLHLIYVHGINAEGPDDSKMLRKSICHILKECTVSEDPRLYAGGPFAIGSPFPQLYYLGRRVWTSQEQWTASAPFIDRYRISGPDHQPIVLDEINWYPLVFPLKCRLLLPGDARLTGNLGKQAHDCLPERNTPDADGQHFDLYRWEPDPTLFSADTPQQHAAWINDGLKIGVMDWGFGDAVGALGPVGGLLTAAIRQLVTQSMDNVVTAGPAGKGDGESPGIHVFFVTHSLGSYLSLAAMDGQWLGLDAPGLTGFQLTSEQKRAANVIAGQNSGFFFLANQIGLLELARLSETPPTSANCAAEAAPATTRVPVSADAAVAHYGCMRQNFVAGQIATGLLPTDARLSGPQIVAWSDANDLLSWYVPEIDGVAVVNYAAHNHARIRVPGVFAWPTDIHDNYARNPSVVRGIFGITRH